MSAAHDDDLLAQPWAYPGRPPHGTGVLRDGTFTPAPWAQVRGLVPRRTPVLAVGSNACPTVLHRKLAGAAVSDHVPFAPATISGVSVGHSAHVSAPGFVAAAPFVASGARTSVWVTWLDDAQLDRLDRTEPNYVRRALPGGRFLLDLPGEVCSAAHCLYDSRWGVLASPGDEPVPLSTQDALHAHLHARWGPYAALLADTVDADAVRAAMLRLAGDGSLRARVREALRRSGWARPSGLAAEDATSVARPGAPASGATPRNAPR